MKKEVFQEVGCFQLSVLCLHWHPNLSLPLVQGSQTADPYRLTDQQVAPAAVSTATMLVRSML